MSIRWRSIFTLERCFKKSVPKPTPFDAPGISPGMSATTKLEYEFICTTPRFGLNVVKG